MTKRNLSYWRIRKVFPRVHSRTDAMFPDSVKWPSQDYVIRSFTTYLFVLFQKCLIWNKMFDVQKKCINKISFNKINKKR